MCKHITQLLKHVNSLFVGYTLHITHNHNNHINNPMVHYG